MTDGRKIIEALEAAVAGDLGRVTIDGQVWVRFENTQAQDRVVAAVRADLLKRSEVGLRKYGRGLDEKGYTDLERLQHIYEELLDGANYIKGLMMAMKGEL